MVDGDIVLKKNPESHLNRPRRCLGFQKVLRCDEGTMRLGQATMAQLGQAPKKKKKKKSSSSLRSVGDDDQLPHSLPS
jgi:hypothetical protein